MNKEVVELILKERNRVFGCLLILAILSGASSWQSDGGAKAGALAGFVVASFILYSVIGRFTFDKELEQKKK